MIIMIKWIIIPTPPPHQASFARVRGSSQSHTPGFQFDLSHVVKEHSCHFIPEALNSPRLDLIFEVSDQIQDQITESQLWPIGSPI